MRKSFSIVAAVVVLLACEQASADIATVARCQKRIASAGANFAKRVINATLKCTNAIAECQVQCEEGVFGAPCDPAPPPCCDPDDRNSMPGFTACMDEADEDCAVQTAKIAQYESTKQQRMTDACDDLTQGELCGAQGNGLNFATLNAGCQALDPTYTCDDVSDLIGCLGGPLQRRLIDQISATLSPGAGDAIAALNLQPSFPDIPVARKVKEDVPQDKADIWSITGNAGDEIKVRVRTRDDNGNSTSNLRPELLLLGNDQSTPIPDTVSSNEGCGVPNACGSTCPQIKRTLPFNGTFYAAVKSVGGGGCTGGKYKLIVVSPGGTVPTLVFDDVNPPGP